MRYGRTNAHTLYLTHTHIHIYMHAIYLCGWHALVHMTVLCWVGPGRARTPCRRNIAHFHGRPSIKVQSDLCQTPAYRLCRCIQINGKHTMMNMYTFRLESENCWLAFHHGQKWIKPSGCVCLWDTFALLSTCHFVCESKIQYYTQTLEIYVHHMFFFIKLRIWQVWERERVDEQPNRSVWNHDARNLFEYVQKRKSIAFFCVATFFFVASFVAIEYVVHNAFIYWI